VYSLLERLAELIFRDSMSSVIDLDIELAEKTLALELEADKLEGRIEASVFDPALRFSSLWAK